MQAPPDPKVGGDAGDGRNHSCSLILPPPLPRRNYSICAVCGVPFPALQAWHTVCLKCYSGDRLFDAITHYQKAVST